MYIVALRWVIEAHQHKLHVIPGNEVDNLAMAMSLIARGVALIPRKKLCNCGDKPTTASTSVLGYMADNSSPVLKAFLQRLEKIIQR